MLNSLISAARRPNAGTRRGVSLVWIALTGLVVLLLVALAADTALVYLTAHQLQNAADAAALAGAQRVKTDPEEAIVAANATAAANRAGGASVVLAANAGNLPGGDVVIGYYDEDNDTFTATTDSPNAVRVLARRTADSPSGALPLIFGPMAGIATSNVSRTATACTGGTFGAGVITLHPTAPCSIRLTGTGARSAKIDVRNGGIQVNSNSSDAVCWTGNPYLIAEELRIHGNATKVIDGGVYPDGDLKLNAPRAPDPLAHLPEPPKGTTRTLSGTTAQPGYYPNGFNPGTSITLQPGIYYIENGITTGGGTIINATSGVMLFIKTGGIDLRGTSNIRINPPTTGTYAFVSLYMARGNTSPVTLRGTTDMNNTGAMYFPSAAVSIQGDPVSFGSQLIASTIHVQGNAQLKIDYNGKFPIPDNKVWLVR